MLTALMIRCEVTYGSLALRSILPGDVENPMKLKLLCLNHENVYMDERDFVVIIAETPHQTSLHCMDQVWLYQCFYKIYKRERCFGK